MTQFSTEEIHKALDEATAAYHEVFDEGVPNEVVRFDATIATARMIVDQSADMAPKNLAADAAEKE